MIAKIGRKADWDILVIVKYLRIPVSDIWVMAKKAPKPFLGYLGDGENNSEGCLEHLSDGEISSEGRFMARLAIEKF